MILNESAWFAICFVIFLLIAFKPIKNAILSFLDGRIKQISCELQMAEKARVAAEEELRLLKEKIALSAQKQHDMLSIAKEEIEKIFNLRCEEFKKSLEYRENAAKDSIKQMQKDALISIEKNFLDNVLGIVSNYFSKKGSATIDLAIVSSEPSIKAPRQKQSLLKSNQ